MNKTLTAIALCSAIAFTTPAMATDAKVFPPDGCVKGQPMMLTWDGENNVMCNPIPNCTANQQLVASSVMVNGVARIYLACNTATPLPPVCTGNGSLQFDGDKFVCVEAGQTTGQGKSLTPPDKDPCDNSRQLLENH